MKKVFLMGMILLAAVMTNAADQFVTFKKSDAAFTVASNGQVKNVVFDANEDEGVQIAVKSLLADFQRVTGRPLKPVRTLLASASS